ncbi:hypothetical protein [Methanospirillum sp.]
MKGPKIVGINKKQPLHGLPLPGTRKRKEQKNRGKCEVPQPSCIQPANKEIINMPGMIAEFLEF